MMVAVQPLCSLNCSNSYLIVKSNFIVIGTSLLSSPIEQVNVESLCCRSKRNNGKRTNFRKRK